MKVRWAIHWMASAVLAGQAAGQAIETLKRTFDAEPDWIGVHHRVSVRGGPRLVQDFGAKEGGWIGGVVQCSRRPAHFGRPIGPASLGERLFASGTIRIDSAPGRSGAYLGFFHSRRQGWRPWSSIMIQLSGSRRGRARTGESTDGVQPWISVVTGRWQADALVTDFFLPADGSLHRWKLDFDPAATVEGGWPDRGIQERFEEKSRWSLEELTVSVGRLDDGIGREQVRSWCAEATRRGHLLYDPRGGTDYWERRSGPEDYRGRVSLQFDDLPAESLFLPKVLLDDETRFDRFGIVNQQTYGRAMKFAIGSVAVEIGGEPAAPSEWMGVDNQVEFVETDCHGRQDFGWTPTSHAGGRKGEIGGTFWRTEPVDPLSGYYADDVGRLTLDDELMFSGKVAFLDGQPDSGMWIGYFNEAELLKKITGVADGQPLDQTMGLVIEGPTRIGWWMSPFVSSRRERYHGIDGPVFLPDRKPREFSFRYDPRGGTGAGRIEMTLDGKTAGFDLRPEDRKAGATFDRFGAASIRRGGKFVEIYFDDLQYRSRRGSQPPRKPPLPGRVTIDYPEGGRRY